MDELLYRATRDWLIKALDKRNFFYPGSYLIAQVIAKFTGTKRSDYSEFSLIGQSHLDACWLWTRKETIEKNFITVNKALMHMEDYPFFKFTMSSPKYFEWTEKYFPEDFERMKERIKEGRFELVGGMWIEPDLMVPNGESIVRQRLYGQRYYLEKFGKMSEIGWLTDVFGYQWTLPQILAKSGSKYFYTNKLGWMDQTEFPFSMFYWQSPDGTKILTYAYSYTINLLAQKQNFGNFKKFARFVKEKNTTLSYENSPEEIEEMRTKEYMDNFGFVYGIGDGGGGPIREEIILLRDMARRFPKNFKFITARDYFTKIEEHASKLPTWNDEMYLEKHRGCYTSHVWLKEFNRRAEIMFFQLESLISLLQPFGFTFDNEKIKKNWLQLLFNQFHDILPGSSIPEVYIDTRIDFRDVFGNLKNYLKKSLNYLCSKVNSSGEGILFYNSLPFERKTLIELENNIVSSLKNRNGEDIPVQESNGKSLFQVVLPPMGYTILKKGAKPTQETKSELKVEAGKSKIILENKHLIVHVSKKTGDISKIYSKDLKKDALTGKGNVVQIFREDRTAFYAWDIDKNYSKKKSLPEFQSISIIENGPVRIGVKIKKTYKEQIIIQSVYLNSGSPRVDMELKMKFHVKKAMAKVAFPINVETFDVHAEIPYAIINRKTKPENAFHEGQWEQNCQKFVTLSDKDISVSLLNNGRYAYDVKYHPKYKNVLRLTIFRTPTYPRGGSPISSIIPNNKWHEQDEFFTKYSLLISKGNHTNPEIKQHALDLNVTPLIHEVKDAKGELPEDISFLELNPSNVFLSAIKLPEDSKENNNTIVLRCYEALGNDCKCEIKFHEKFSIMGVDEVDLLEFNPSKINSFDKQSLRFDIKKFEIKTFKIKFS